MKKNEELIALGEKLVNGELHCYYVCDGYNEGRKVYSVRIVEAKGKRKPIAEFISVFGNSPFSRYAAVHAINNQLGYCHFNYGLDFHTK